MTNFSLLVTLLNHLIRSTVVLAPTVKVKGNLKLNVAFWEHIGASSFILDTILDGLKIPFIYTPPSPHFFTNRSTIQYSDFVEHAISDLLATGSEIECEFLQIFSFTTSAFATGPYVFTKVMRPLVRLQAFRIAAYLDDGLGVYPTFAECCSQSMAVKSDLFCAGFVVNTQKSILAPVQSLRWLGYRLDLKDNLLTVPEEKIDKSLRVVYLLGNWLLSRVVLFLIRSFSVMCAKL